jgi:hypothetical protein
MQILVVFEKFIPFLSRHRRDKGGDGEILKPLNKLSNYIRIS